MTKQDEILFIESELNVRLPDSYRDFLLSRGSDIAFGLPVLGLPATYDISSALGATSLLRMARPELDNCIAIRILDERMLCLDISKGSRNDAPLIEVNLNAEDQPTNIYPSFSSYLSEADQSKKEVEYALRRIKNLFANGLVKQYGHAENEGKIPFKARDWRVHRCCVHDMIVGLAAFKYNESYNGIEVDVFITTDHPAYEEGHGVKSLMALILSDAYRNGTGMEVRFTRFDNREGKRIADPVPKALLNYLKSLGIQLTRQREGVISHEEAIGIFSSLLGVQEDVKSRIKEREETTGITLQGLCFLINSRVWTIEQVNWLIINAERVKAIIFGRDNPESRLNYCESLALGRSACALTRLKEKIEISAEEVNEVEIKITGIFFQLTVLRQCMINWLPGDEYYEIEEGETITVLSRPRQRWTDFKAQIIEDIKAISIAEGKTVILYTNEILEYENINIMQEAVREAANLGHLEIMVMPVSAEELNEEVVIKMKKARTYRV